MAKPERKITFMGWRDELPRKDTSYSQISEYDLLRVVLLAEDARDRRWVEFKCEDRMHAIKVAHMIRSYEFNVEVKAHNDRVFARRSE